MNFKGKKYLKIFSFLITLVIAFNPNLAFAEDGEWTCPSGYDLSGTDCVKVEKAHWRNGVYYCESGEPDGKNCVYTIPASKVNTEKEDSNQVLLCQYRNFLSNNDFHIIKIYKKAEKKPEGTYYKWKVEFSEASNDNFIKKDWDTFNNIFGDNGSPNIYMESSAKNNLRDNFQCPKKAYLDTQWFYELCLDNDGNYCKSISDSSSTIFAEADGSIAKYSSIVYDGVEKVIKNIKKDVNNIAENASFQDYKNGTLIGSIKDKVNFYVYDTLKEVPNSVEKYVASRAEEINSDVAKKLIENKDEFKKQAEDNYQHGKLSQQEYDDLIKAIDSLAFETVLNNLNEQLYNELVQPGGIIPTNVDCEYFLGDPKIKYSPAWYLVKAFEIIKYIAIVILIVLSTVDLIGAVASKDQDVVKKAVNKTLIRLALCIVIFLLPTLLEFILHLVFENVDMCGI